MLRIGQIDWDLDKDVVRKNEIGRGRTFGLKALGNKLVQFGGLNAADGERSP